MDKQLTISWDEACESVQAQEIHDQEHACSLSYGAFRLLLGEIMIFISTHIYFSYHTSVAINHYLIEKLLFNWKIAL